MNINYTLKKIIRRRELQREKITRIRRIVILLSVFFVGIFIGNIFTQNDFSITGLVTGALPDVGDSNWGTILNNYLLQEHTTTGSHKNVTVEGDIKADNWTNVSITESQISDLQSYRTLDNLTFVGDGNFTGNLNVIGNLTDSSGRIISVPSGMVSAFSGANCPTDWILANGTDGTPDLRGIFIRGAGINDFLNMSNGTAFSATQGTYQNDSMQQITGSWKGSPVVRRSGSETSTGALSGIIGGNIAPGGSTSASFVGVDFDSADSTAQGGARTEAETRPASYALIYCVKT